VSINISQSNTTLLSGNSSTAQTTAASSIGQSDSNPSHKADKTAEDISISTRAQKLQKLSKEFFPSGPQSLKITPQFIQRLQEFGFISASQAENLNPQVTSSETESGTKTVGELKAFTETLGSKLKKESPGHSLIDVLEKSQEVLGGFDKTLASPKETNYSSLINTLTEFVNSPDTNTLSQSDKNGLKTLAITISIADKLGSAESTTKEINQYLSILNRW